jgi:hypothetical protein
MAVLRLSELLGLTIWRERMSGLSEWFPTQVKVLTETDQVTIAMLRSLIANIEAGNVTVLDRSGHQRDVATVELTMILNGNPDITLKG